MKTPRSRFQSIQRAVTELRVELPESMEVESAFGYLDEGLALLDDAIANANGPSGE